MRRLVLPLLIALMAIIYIVFIVPSGVLELKMIFKLIPMMLIIIFAFQRLPDRPVRSLYLIITGLIFCMFGDALILISFTAGLAAFLIGHIFYIILFLKMSRITRLRLIAFMPIACYSFFMGQRLIHALSAAGNTAFIVPVIAYICVISLMIYSAVLTGNKWAVSGSILFVLSDSVLSWNMFVSAVQHADLIIMSTYYAAQFLIANSIYTIGNKK